MDLFTPTFQIVSDLHLKTPVAAPRYTTFKLSVKSDNLLLLGDTGLETDIRLLNWLRNLLEDNRLCWIFYVMGNHESYCTTHKEAVGVLQEFKKEAKDSYSGRFIF
jgi:hypothetical protein